jgi:RNA polymerase primary sigma factor
MDMFNGNYLGQGQAPKPGLNRKRPACKAKTTVASRRAVATKRAMKGLEVPKGKAMSAAAPRLSIVPKAHPEVRFEEPVQVLPSTPPAVEPRESVPTSEGAGSALAAYLRDVGEVPLLTPDQEIELAARIKKGDRAAREHMIRANLRLVVKIARDYEHLGLPLLDLISEGTIGLMKAVDRFDPAKGGKLSTYGSWWIKQQIRRALANQGRTIRLPVHVEAKIYRLGRAEARLRDVLGREATDEEVAGELGVDPRKISRLRDSAIRPTSLDATLGDDDSSTIGEVVRDDKAATPYECYEQKADHHLLRKFLTRLPAREAEILTARFGLNGEDEQTLEELGVKFGLTRERIRQLQNEAFKKLRQMMEQSPRLMAAA